MLGRQVQCPACGTILSVPPGYANCFVRCGLCHERFRLPEHVALSDQIVADWLRDERDREEHDEDVAADAIDASKQALREASASGKTQVLPAMAAQIRLRRLDSRGAVFEFPAARLLEVDFRCAMPRRCLRCGTRQRLVAHMIIYAPSLVDSFSLEAEHAAGQLSISQEALGDVSGSVLLEKLPQVPNVPPPGNLPMPYWLCDGCNGSGLISGQIHVNPASGKGRCRLFIQNLGLAEEFFMAAGGTEGEALEEIRRRAQASAANPWDSLPETVQRRLHGWYQAARGERFLAYVPDRDRARSEDGLYGIIVSSERLIFHTKLNHHQAARRDPLELSLAISPERTRLRIKCATWDVQHFTVDRDGLAHLRRAVADGQFEATWA